MHAISCRQQISPNFESGCVKKLCVVLYRVRYAGYVLLLSI
jgi:hypothetical protein